MLYYGKLVNYVKARLIGGDQYSYGRLQVNYNNTWGTVCRRGFTIDTADIVCLQLGFTSGAASFNVSGPSGSENSTIWLSNINCAGNESNLAECSHSYWGQTGCSHDEDVTIACIRGTVYLTVFVCYKKNTEMFGNDINCFTYIYQGA